MGYLFIDMVLTIKGNIMKYSNIQRATELLVTWEVNDDKINKSETLSYCHSQHSFKKGESKKHT